MTYGTLKRASTSADERRGVYSDGSAIGLRSLGIGSLAILAACSHPVVARDGTLVFQQGGGHGAAVMTANGLEYKDNSDVLAARRPRRLDEPWRALIGFILALPTAASPQTSTPHVLATPKGLAIVLSPERHAWSRPGAARCSSAST